MLKMSVIVFGKCSVRISVGTPTILTEVFRDFPQLIRPNIGIAPQLVHDHLLHNSFQFTIRR
jgi:hypothetical protein